MTTLGLFVVLLMGFLVTQTDSARGCGSTWPLCHGKLIPAFTIHAMVEWSHRAVTGVVSVLIVVFSVWAWRRHARRTDVKLLAVVGLAFLVLQGYLGAEAALSNPSAAVLALHFGVSMTAFAGIVLLTALVIQLGGPVGTRRERTVPVGLRYLVWGILVYMYVVTYVGAYLARLGTGLSCVGWPLCSGTLIPALTGPVVVPFLHRVLALGALILAVVLVVRMRSVRGQRPDLYRGSHWVMGFTLIQALAGGLLILTRLDILAVILHVTLASILFAALSYLCLQVLPEPFALRQDSASSGARLMDPGAGPASP